VRAASLPHDSWAEIEPFAMADGQKVYASRALVTFGN